MTNLLRHIALIAFAMILAMIGLWQLSKVREFQLFGQSIARVETTQMRVALTFDDGPTPRFTPEVLTVLENHDIPATFFVTGREASAAPDLVQMIAQAGHEIGNHSYSHSRMVLRRPGFMRDEIARTDDAIRAGGYLGPIHFRPPFGKRLFVLPWVLAEQERLTVMWNLDADSDPSLGAETLANRVIETAQPGDIILMHVMYASRDASRAALPEIIEGLHDRGFEFVTVSELISAP